MLFKSWSELWMIWMFLIGDTHHSFELDMIIELDENEDVDLIRTLWVKSRITMADDRSKQNRKTAPKLCIKVDGKYKGEDFI